VALLCPIALLRRWVFTPSGYWATSKSPHKSHWATRGTAVFFVQWIQLASPSLDFYILRVLSHPTTPRSYPFGGLSPAKSRAIVLHFENVCQHVKRYKIFNTKYAQQNIFFILIIKTTSSINGTTCRGPPPPPLIIISGPLFFENASFFLISLLSYLKMILYLYYHSIIIILYTFYRALLNFIFYFIFSFYVCFVNFRQFIYFKIE